METKRKYTKYAKGDGKKKGYTNPLTGKTLLAEEWAKRLDITVETFRNRFQVWLDDQGEPDYERIYTQSGRAWKKGAAKRGANRIKTFQTSAYISDWLYIKYQEHLEKSNTEFAVDVVRKAIENFDINVSLDKYSHCLKKLRGKEYRILGIKINHKQLAKLNEFRTKHSLNLTDAVSVVLCNYLDKSAIAPAPVPVAVGVARKIIGLRQKYIQS